MAKTKKIDASAAQRIKKWREGAIRLSRLELSRLLDVTKTSVSNWELGHNEPREGVYRDLAGMASGDHREWFLGKAGLTDEQLDALKQGSQPGKIKPTPPPKAKLDTELLTYVFEAIFNRQHGITEQIAPTKCAEVAVLFYDICNETGHRDISILERLLKMAEADPGR